MNPDYTYYKELRLALCKKYDLLHEAANVLRKAGFPVYALDTSSSAEIFWLSAITAAKRGLAGCNMQTLEDLAK